jgi:site-specific DNA-methyltransferase (adenine-specific)
VCYKQKPTFNRDDVREPYSNQYIHSNGKVRKATKGRFSDGTKKTVYKVHPKGALPRDVLKIPALAGGAGSNERVEHPTQKPLALCRKLIEASRNKVGDTFLLVPFAGSGSECVAGQALGVSFLGFEINPEYVSLSNERLNV